MAGLLHAHADSPELNVVFEAMKAGALDVVPKPADFGSTRSGDWEEDLVTKVKTIAGIHPKPISTFGGSSKI